MLTSHNRYGCTAISHWHSMFQRFTVGLSIGSFSRRFAAVTLDAQSPEVILIIAATELKGDTVVELAAVQVHDSLAHAAVAAVTHVDSALQAHSCAAANAPCFTVHWLNAPCVDGFKPGLQGLQLSHKTSRLCAVLSGELHQDGARLFQRRRDPPATSRDK